MRWADFQHQQSAILAKDEIPLHYGDVKTEYHAALEHAVLMDRSHEGRLEIRGKSRLDLIQRISTNDVLSIPIGMGKPTLFTNANGRIIDRVMVYNQGETALLTTEAGRGNAVHSYLQRQIFFNDDFQISDLSNTTRLFTLHGNEGEQVIETLTNSLSAHSLSDSPYRSLSLKTPDEVEFLLLERKELTGAHWAVLTANENAEAVWMTFINAGKSTGLIPAGSLVYNLLRIRAGRPAAGRELSLDYIPLEAGLWDEVSFSKGCYTGQEILARMESRSRLAKTMVKLELSQMVDAPANLYDEGKIVGTLTSSVTSPDGEIMGIGFVKTALAQKGQGLIAGESAVQATISALAGAQPPKVPVD